MTLHCFAHDRAGARRLAVMAASDWDQGKSRFGAMAATWAEASGFKPRAGAVLLVPDAGGAAALAVLLVSSPAEASDAAQALASLPPGDWFLDDPAGLLPLDKASLGWAMAAYRFDRYKRPDDPMPRLVLDDPAAAARGIRLATSIWQARDLINLPANELGPAELLEAIAETGARHGATVRMIRGDELLSAGFPLVHAVGRASVRAPGLVDVQWGDPAHSKVTLVGKGVCFDTGGLDIKPSSNMLLMKKDMGGAAIMTGLADAVMDAGLPVRLRLIVPAVENSIAGAAFRPGDVLRSRKGLTVEIGNTDAEGRLILADGLALADEETPDLLIDAATLTGAARVAVGPELPALFTADEDLAQSLLRGGMEAGDPMWRLPLHAPYKRLIESSIADLNNAGQSPFAGAITAALFLQAFVTQTKPYAHLDLFAWNQESRPGRPKGGEATGLQALYTALEQRYPR
ncbi:MAG TPA: leucyl aminopeptidase family protein [Geminicoccus sp.]|jgi:leucyl aminopeptidase|uniref:leucyl aminopeptidase family protein n=1 Tax=Geminicoccus sp. TaxID=2024832 RepID=UPI002E3021F8|nr:leucyl aminopeptidase family protein [Geminicoccus sp.]HEX2527470.1 leucyl aminopeptidase family protein [Geminicoccus sp.]